MLDQIIKILQTYFKSVSFSSCNQPLFNFKKLNPCPESEKVSNVKSAYKYETLLDSHLARSSAWVWKVSTFKLLLVRKLNKISK